MGGRNGTRGAGYSCGKVFAALFLLLLAGGAVWAGEGKAESEPATPPAYEVPTSLMPFEEIDIETFMRQLVYKLKRFHVELSPEDPQYGMMYESKDMTRQLFIEGNGRDTMHNMMWVISALTIAYRATEDPHYLDFMLKYPYRFHVQMMLKGDEIFGQPYGKGFSPYYWDNGTSYELGAYPHDMGIPEFRVDGFSKHSSIHMAQNIAVAYMNTWYLLRDPEVAKASEYLYEQFRYGYSALSRYRQFQRRAYVMLGKEAGGGMKKGKEIWNEMSWPERKAYAKKHRVYPDSFGPVVTTAFSVTNPEQAVEGYGTGARMGAYKFKPRAVGFWNGLRRHAPHGLPGHEDTVCYDYYEHVNNAMHRAFSKEFARYFTLRFLMTHQVAKYFVDDAPYKYGLMIYTHPAMGAFAKFERGTGKLAGYTSEIRHRTWHLRGFQHVWGSAVALQMMDAYPEMHEEYRKEIAPDAPVVRIVDETPEVDGAADESYGDSIELAGGSVRMVADPRNLCLLLRPPEGKGYTLTLHEFLEPKGNFARVVVDAAGKVTVTNHEEKALLAWSAKGKDGVEVQIPFTIYRPQGLWMNATEHAQCLLEAGEDGAAKTPIYFLSTHKRWTEQLRRIVEQGIANGKYVLDFNDYLPYNYSDLSKPDWHDLSFAAAYGWLLAACAEYRLWQDGRNDWESTKEMKLPIDEARKAILAAADKQEAYARPWELGEGTPSTTVECPASAIKPTIDGVVTEEEWKDAGRTQGMYALPSMYSTATIGSQEVGVADAAYQGIVLLKRDDENLYLAFGCGEPHPEGLSFDETLRQGPLWNDDRVEIFLDTDHDQKSYMHLIINGVGTYYTALGTGWDWTADAQIATKIANRAWYMEVAIPLKALDGVPESGAKWGANFTIYRTQRLQNFTWSPLRAAWLHAPKQFGTIVFP